MSAVGNHIQKMTDPFDIAKEYLKKPDQPAPRAWIIDQILTPDGAVPRALKVCSEALHAHIWFVIDPAFEPPADGLAVFYLRELPALRGKTPTELQIIHAAKLGFGAGTRVRQ